jgi:phage tail sheath protein FI
MRQAVNGALRGHAEYLGDRIAYVNGPQGQALADVKTDVGNYRSVRTVYVDPWPFILDDTDGTKRLVPPAAFAASVAAQLSPSTSIAWKDPQVLAMLEGIVDIEADRGQGTADNTDNGVVTIIAEDDGGFSLEAGVLTIAASDPSRKNLSRTRTGDYIAVSFAKSVRASVDAPSVQLNWDGLLLALEVFMDGMGQNSKTDPNHRPHVLGYDIPALSSVNSDSDLESGELYIPLDAKFFAAQEKIFLSIQFGENVTINHQA